MLTTARPRGSLPLDTVRVVLDVIPCVSEGAMFTTPATRRRPIAITVLTCGRRTRATPIGGVRTASAALERQRHPHDYDSRRDHHRNGPGRSLTRQAAGRRRAASRRSSSDSWWAAPASIPAASRPRRWSPAPMRPTWPGAQPTSACGSRGPVSVDLAQVKARKDAISAAIARRPREDADHHRPVRVDPRPCALSRAARG